MAVHTYCSQRSAHSSARRLSSDAYAGIDDAAGEPAAVIRDAMKRSPLASRRRPDNPPKPANGDVSTRPLRYSSDPNRTCERSRGSNAGMGRAWTSTPTGAAAENSSGLICLACADAARGIAAAASPVAVHSRKRRREMAADLGPVLETWTAALSPPPSGRGEFVAPSGQETMNAAGAGRRCGAGGAPWVSLNSSASFSVMAPPSSSASTMVTARR